MKITPLKIPDVLLLEPEVFEDARGYFFESFNANSLFAATSQNISFVQENHSKSKKGVLRGLHYQLPPFAQGKLVRVIEGEVLDVAVDIRKSSPTFGQHVCQLLCAKSNQQIWIPEGFAHGFLTISEVSEFLYKTTNYYSQESERSIRWDDEFLQIEWPKDVSIHTSDRDCLASLFWESEVFS